MGGHIAIPAPFKFISQPAHSHMWLNKGGFTLRHILLARLSKLVSTGSHVEK
jgi:hypothetical protein